MLETDRLAGRAAGEGGALAGWDAGLEAEVPDDGISWTST